MSLTKGEIEARFLNEKCFRYYMPLELYRNNKWQCAISCRFNCVIYCDPLQEYSSKSDKMENHIDKVENWVKMERWDSINKDNNAFAELGTNIKLSLWNWKDILYFGRDYSPAQANYRVDLRCYYNDVIKYLPVSFDELLTAFNHFHDSSSTIAIILNRMIDLNIECDNPEHKTKILDMKTLPVYDQALTIYIPDGNMFYNYPVNFYSSNSARLVKEVLKVQVHFSDRAKKIAIYRLIEYGFLPREIKSNAISCIDRLDSFVDKAIEKLRAINCQVRRSLMFLPSDVKNIVYDYIVWWKNANASRDFEMCLLWEEKYNNYKAYTDNKILSLTAQVEELSKKLKFTSS